ncbi:hypothetical protein KUTeg_010627 [Tegillarca granosa]|uniref:Impact N-terminal domain-containing protein n=1 Tax=Tegillarca granosa TaxID=220873 RepID=A0ABQ9F332_TEGGR|nr:hypothetical protein KUTeg_010627 [Tegillarca granosa]
MSYFLQLLWNKNVLFFPFCWYDITKVCGCPPLFPANHVTTTVSDVLLRFKKNGIRILNVLFNSVWNFPELLKTAETKNVKVNAKLDSVIQEGNNHLADITLLQEENKRINKDVDLLRAYAIRMEKRLEFLEKLLTDLPRRSMKKNIVITGLEEKEHENLRHVVSDIFKKDLLTGDKLIIKRNGTLYREKIETLKATDVFHHSKYVKPKYKIATGDYLAENGNFIQGHALPVSNKQEVRAGLLQKLASPTTASCSHNILAYRYVGPNGVINDGVEDDGEYGGGRCILNAMEGEGINNALVVVSRVFGQKLGYKRFSYFKNAARTALQKASSGALNN